MARQKPLIAALCLTVFCSVLNGTMFNVAVPDIARDYSLKATEVSWVITGYIALFALGALTFGKLADSYPVRRLIIIGLILFNSGALLGLLSNSYIQLVIARLIQACGGSSIPALSMLTATRFVPADRRGRVLGAFAATVAFATGIGPMLGGFLGGFWHWRYLFIISLLSLLILPAYLIFLPREKLQYKPYDLPGAILTGAVVGSGLLFVASAWWPGLLTALTASALLTWHLRRAKHPFLPWGLLANRPYLLALATTFLTIGTVFGMMFLLPILLRDLHQLPTLQIGLVIFPAAMCAFVMGLFAGYLADRIGALWVVRRGLPLLGCGFLLLTIASDAPLSGLILILIVSYSGFAFIHASLAKTVSLILPHGEAGVGMGLYNLVFFLSGAFGTAIAGQLCELFASFPRLTIWVAAPAQPFSGVFFCMFGTILAAILVIGQIPQDQLGTPSKTPSAAP